jgi:hypothetical protein
MSAGPTRPTTFRPQAFSASRRFTPPPTFRTFRCGDARGVLPTRVSPPEQASRLVAFWIPLMALFPRCAHSPPRKERTVGARTTFLGRSPSSPLVPTGCCSVRKSVPCGEIVKSRCRSIPSWAYSSRGCSRREAGGISPPPLTCLATACFEPASCDADPLPAVAAPQRL